MVVLYGEGGISDVTAKVAVRTIHRRLYVDRTAYPAIPSGQPIPWGTADEPWAAVRPVVRGEKQRKAVADCYGGDLLRTVRDVRDNGFATTLALYREQAISDVTANAVARTIHRHVNVYRAACPAKCCETSIPWRTFDEFWDAVRPAVADDDQRKAVASCSGGDLVHLVHGARDNPLPSSLSRGEILDLTTRAVVRTSHRRVYARREAVYPAVPSGQPIPWKGFDEFWGAVRPVVGDERQSQVVVDCNGNDLLHLVYDAREGAFAKTLAAYGAGAILDLTRKR